jgi:hypothetical protein
MINYVIYFYYDPVFTQTFKGKEQPDLAKAFQLPIILIRIKDPYRGL